MIGVLGGTGVTGSQVVAALKAKGADFKCIVRDPDTARAKLGPDVAVVQGDLSDPASLDSAFEGLDTLFLLCGHSPKLGEFMLNGIEAAKRSGISYIVDSSGSEKGITPDNPSQIMQQHYHVEQAVKDSGIKWAMSRPNFFMSNLLAMAEPIAQAGKFITALPGEGVISMIHPLDIGESAAELLTDDKYAGEGYFLTGKAITLNDVVAALSETLGREIAYVQVPPEAARAAMVEKGMPDWLIDHMGSMMGFCAQGGMAGETDWVDKLTGHAPRTISEWIGEHRAAFS